MNCICLLPVNLYGPGDRFQPETSHVIPSIIRKCLEAVATGVSEIVLSGGRVSDKGVSLVTDAAEGIIAATSATTSSTSAAARKSPSGILP
jgi:GDP-L-fucose synthase